jgi:hypothetical protein
MLTIENIRNPVFSNNEGTAIDCLIKFEEFSEEHPFNATSFDSMEHGRLAYQRIMAGEFGEIGEFVEYLPIPVSANAANNQPATTGSQDL